MEEGKTEGAIVPYIDFRLYNTAKVGYDMECNAVKRCFAGGSQYELKKALGKIYFKPPQACDNAKTYFLVGYFAPLGIQPKKEQITLIYLVFGKKCVEIIAVRHCADGLYRACADYEWLNAAQGSLNTVLNFKLAPEKRISAIKRLIGLGRRQTLGSAGGA